jgi:nucleoside-diphosphate-sugar epimerase
MKDELQMKIPVIGGTGNVGSEVVKELTKRHADVRLLVRKPVEKTTPALETVVGDLLDPVSIEKAMNGVDKLYLLNAVTPDELTQGLVAYDLARKHELSHVVYHSVFRVEHFKDVPHFASKLAIEGAIREFGVPFKISRPRVCGISPRPSDSATNRCRSTVCKHVISKDNWSGKRDSNARPQPWQDYDRTLLSR